MAGTSPALVAGREGDAAAASAVKALQAAGEHADARERYAELVSRHQRRASRIAYHYLRDAAEADEAVQDAFVKAYQHLASFREELPFDVWFTRILINGCLDRIKAPVDQDAREPDVERELLTERSQVLVRFDEGVLHRLIGFGSVAQVVIRDP